MTSILDPTSFAWRAMATVWQANAERERDHGNVRAATYLTRRAQRCLAQATAADVATERLSTASVGYVLHAPGYGEAWKIAHPVARILTWCGKAVSAMRIGSNWQETTCDACHEQYRRHIAALDQRRTRYPDGPRHG